jgi:hypothetical protein
MPARTTKVQLEITHFFLQLGVFCRNVPTQLGMWMGFEKRVNLGFVRVRHYSPQI